MIKKLIAFTLCGLLVCNVGVFGSDDVKADSPSSSDLQTVQFFSENFESFASSTDLTAAWSSSGSAADIKLVTDDTVNTTKFAKVSPKGGESQLTFNTPVALDSSRGESLGTNVKLNAEFSLARYGTSGEGNWIWCTLTDSNAESGNDALGVLTQIQNIATNTALYRYGNWNDDAPNLYTGPANSWYTSSGEGVWVKFKFVVSITDAMGKYITPTVDVYAAPYGEAFSATPVLSGQKLINPVHQINAFRIGTTTSGNMAYALDDINIYVTRDSAVIPDEPTEGFPIPSGADENSRYVTPQGAGKRDGTSWSNAFKGSTSSALQAAWDATPNNGTLYVGSGKYYNVAISASSATSGQSKNAPKRLVGIETVSGQGTPIYEANVKEGERNSDTSFFTIGDGANYIGVENLNIYDYYSGVRAYKVAVTGITVRKLYVENANDCVMFAGKQRGYKSDTADITDIVVQDSTFKYYKKNGLALRWGVQDVLVTNVLADAGGAEKWLPGNWPIGFGMGYEDVDGINKNFTFIDCIALDSFHMKPLGYWNSDGFSAERTEKNLTFIRSYAFGSTDGGWDLKAHNVEFIDCVGMDNKNNFKLWGQNVTLTNILSAYAYKRGGTGENTGLWVGEDGVPGGAQVEVYNSSFINNAGTQIEMWRGDEPDKYLVEGSLTLHDCILANYVDDKPLIDGQTDKVHMYNTKLYSKYLRIGVDPLIKAPRPDRFYATDDRFNSILYNGSIGYWFGDKPAPNKTGYSLSIMGEAAGGVGKTREITVTGENADNLIGMFLVVKVTKGSGSSAKTSVTMIPAANDITISYQAAGSRVDVWLTSAMPDLTGDSPKGAFLAYATTTPAQRDTDKTHNH